MRYPVSQTDILYMSVNSSNTSIHQKYFLKTSQRFGYFLTAPYLMVWLFLTAWPVQAADSFSIQTHTCTRIIVSFIFTRRWSLCNIRNREYLFLDIIHVELSMLVSSDTELRMLGFRNEEPRGWVSTDAESRTMVYSRYRTERDGYRKESPN